MKINQTKIERIISLAKAYGATRLILFGSAAENPEEAVDIDIACDGIPGWKLFEMAAFGGNGSRGYGRIAFEGIGFPTNPFDPFKEKCETA